MPQVTAISQQIWDMKYRFKTSDGRPFDRTIEDSWRRVADALAAPEPERERWADAFYQALEDFKFLPAGRILAGAGTERTVTLFNCFVMGTIPDDMGGIFTHLRSASFPFQHQQLGVYFCLTDAEGTYRFEIDLFFLNTNQLVCRATLPHIDIGDRLQISDFGINLPVIVFPAPGRYEFRLRIGHTIIAQKDFNVINLPAQPAPDGSPEL